MSYVVKDFEAGLCSWVIDQDRTRMPDFEAGRWFLGYRPGS